MLKSAAPKGAGFRLFCLPPFLRIIIINCQYCQKPVRQKYCNPTCQHRWKYENITIPKILAGEYSAAANKNKRTILKFLTELNGHKCSGCRLEQWQNQKIPLDIDHVDGNNKNNLPENLRLLCPNCHRLTETWGNSKKQRELKSHGSVGKDVTLTS